MRKFCFKSLRILLSFALILCSFLIKAEVKPIWNLNLGSNILWQKVTPTGHLVVCTQEALQGIDPEKGQVTWKINSLGNIPAEHYEELPNTFFVQIVNNKDVIILDPMQGNIICNTKAAGYTSVLTKNVLYSSGTVLVSGFKGSLKPNMSLFEIASGKELWSRDDVFKNSGSGGGKLMAFASMMDAASSDAGAGSFEIIEINEKEIIISSSSGLFKVNTKNGDQIWSAELPKPKGAVSASTDMKLFRSPVAPMFYYGKSNYIMAYHIADGKQAWKEVVKISGIVDQIIYLKEGLILCPKIDPANTMFKPVLNMVDYKTGETLWGKNSKGLKIEGGVTNYIFTKAGIVISMQNENKSFLNILNPSNGTFKFDNPLKIKGQLIHSELTPKGLLYITKSDAYTQGEVNFFDLNNGNALFKKPIDSGKDIPLLTADDRDKMYIFSNKDLVLYEVDKISGTYKAMTGKIELQGKEQATSLEIMPAGLALISDQNLVLMNFEGKIISQKYHEAPRLPGITRALLVARAVAASYDAARYGMASAAFTDASGKTDDVMAQAIFDGMGKGLASASEANMAYSKSAMNAAKARFKATANTKDFVYMMVNLPERNRSYGLAKVSKSSGEILEIIDMKKDKEPNYEVDNISNIIYYRENPNQLVCYKL